MKSFTELTNLKANRARMALLDKQIPILCRLADKLQNDVSLHALQFGDDAGNIRATGSHSDPTARRALCDLPDDVQQLLEDIRRMTIERHRTAAYVEMAEAALSFLPDRERQIVELRAVENMSWFDVVGSLFDRTGDLIAESTARACYERACVKIAPFFQCNSTGNDSEGKHEYHRSATA